jgi:ribosomal protein L7/L12
MDESLEADVRSLLTQNRKIEAIKIYRERTGVGLAEAKDAVERLEQGSTLADEGPLPANIDSRLLELLMAGRKIEAIKLYRVQTHSGLKEAKEAVEALATRNGVAPQRIGCFGVLAAMLVSVSVVLFGWLSRDREYSALLDANMAEFTRRVAWRLAMK